MQVSIFNSCAVGYNSMLVRCFNCKKEIVAPQVQYDISELVLRGMKYEDSIELLQHLTLSTYCNDCKIQHVPGISEIQRLFPQRDYTPIINGLLNGTTIFPQLQAINDLISP